MKIATWNVNSIRARLDRVQAWLESRDPDVVCVQETKAQEADFPGEAIEKSGYRFCCRGQKTYNGVAILSKHPIENVVMDFDDSGDESQARFIGARIRDIEFLCLYVPNGKTVGSEAFHYKLEWLGRLRAFIDRRYRADQALILAGDYNVAPDDRDVHDPDEWRDQVLCHPDERAALEKITEFGLKDSYRLLHEEGGVYSWWDYRRLGFPKNRGLRIDHLLISQPLVSRCAEAWVDREERKGKGASDHAPVFIRLSDG